MKKGTFVSSQYKLFNGTPFTPLFNMKKGILFRHNISFSTELHLHHFINMKKGTFVSSQYKLFNGTPLFVT